MLKKIDELLSGRRTYLLGAVAIVWAVYGWYTGELNAEQASQVAWGGLTAWALRAGVEKNKK